jgi:UDP-GlcNAc:undecaprenyl-phosphate/decaprenyl-phosphate GlcNAc-1-phosphate transferase
MSTWAMIFHGLLGMGIVLAGVPLILKTARAVKLSPRAQDLHHGLQPAVPRLGGLALVAAFVAIELSQAILYTGGRERLSESWVVALSSLAMFGVGFWDDLKPLGAKRKLAGQVLIAAAVCLSGIGIEHFKIPFTGQIIALHGWGALLTIGWLVGMTNLINLIDGVDGLAGGICLMLMALLAYVGHQSGSIGVIAWGMAGALLAFLWYNFPPARIYLGDGGAYLLGFQIGLFAILSSNKGTVFAALVAPLFVLALPILDMALAILRRGLRGLPIFRPDRKHIHHHLLQMGLSRRKAVLSLYAVTLIFLAMGFAVFASRGQLIPLLLGMGIIVLLICAGKLSFSREWFAVGRVVGNSLGMRQEVHYALSLTRWLALEGNRCSSVEELWSNLVFAAQRLGFTHVNLTLADGTRTWEHANGCEPSQSMRRELQGGRFGVLELKAPTCDLGNGSPASPSPRPSDCKRAFCPCVSEGRVFGIVSDLLAEGWLKAAIKWTDGGEVPLRFDACLSVPRNQLQSQYLRTYAPRRFSPSGPKPVQPPLKDMAG